MLRLILMRHAKSDWSHQGLTDHERPLNARGQRSATALGKWLHDRGYRPDQVLCSSSRRTRQTLLGLDLGAPADISFTRALYLAQAGDMVQELRAASARCVLMLGHNPGISELAQRLSGGPVDHDRFGDYPTGATLVVDFDTDDWNEIDRHQGQPIDFTIPAELP